jgi:putative phosphoserine phosphatase/1-acylglycerol-3-phosphate O-acyltransferase
MTGAAFFDLDRTLLAGASGPVYAAAMRRAGVASGRELPGERLLFGVFNRVGETLPSMLLARQGVGLARGKSQSATRRAAEEAADELAGLVQPFAAGLIAEHRTAGRTVVMATTTPEDWARPLAERLGLDDVVATRWEVDGDRYTGDIHGPFVWSAGKLSAVRTWALAHGVDLRESWAYSDSVYDAPLLAAVAHPVAVNPDPRLLVMAALRRWPVLHLDVPPGVAKVPLVGVELQRLLMQLARPIAFPYARFDIDGTEHLPVAGPAILVGNHRSYFDTAAIAVTIARHGRPVRFLGKKEVFDAPIIGTLAAAMGGIRVERGTGSDEPLASAIAALDAGEVVALMPQGTIPRGEAFFDPVLRGRWGAARLAAATRAPVIPIGLWGTERVWPRSSRLPNVFNVTNPPVVRVRVGEPVKLAYKSTDADTKKIMKAIVKLLPPEAREPRVPTAEELARTYPPGQVQVSAPAGERARRPGSD